VAASAVAVVLGASLPVLPVLLRNHEVSGLWILQTNSGVNFYMGNYPGADGTPNIHAGRPWARLVAMAPERGILSPPDQDAFYRGLALRWMREEPGRALALFGRKLFLFWNAYETRPSLDVYYFRRLSPVLSFPWPGFGILAPLALLGAGLALGRRRPEPDLLLLYALVYTLATASFMVSSRYRIPIVQAALPLAGIAAADLTRRLRSGNPRAALGPAAALIVLAMAVRWTPADLHVRDNAEERYNEGTRLMEMGRLTEAEGAFRRAWAEKQDDGRIAGNLGALLVRTGRAPEALGWLRTAVRLYPELADLWGNLGAAAMIAGHPEESEKAYRESLRIDPNRGPPRLGYGLLLLSRGDRDGAAREFAQARRLGVTLPPEAAAVLAPP
jgi:tetratricopeptide (TPR) repeat protein